LAPLALWMHETSPGVGLVKRAALRRELLAIYEGRGVPDPAQAARRLLADVREHAGLLLERGAGTYGFIHLTFQEYLAAVAIAQRGQRDVGPVVEALAARVGDDNWREVTLLAVGYLGIIQQRDEAAGEVVGQLLARAPGEPGQATVLAGEAVLDAWPGGVTPRCHAHVVQTLVETLGDDEHVRAHWRAAAGDVLARLGDPRPEVTTLEGMALCHVPAGPFWMGSPDEDEMAFDDEKPLHQAELPYDYWLARYPVTVAKFRAFAEAVGRVSEFSRSLRGLDNHPVVRVTWHEAMTFCEWLTATWQAAGLLPLDWVVRLPSEREWEKGARGGIEVPRAPQVLIPEAALAGRERPALRPNPHPRRRYPWGDDPDPERANYGDTGIKSTSAVGCFPGGASPYGCLDMSGNVWEWTVSLWGEDWESPAFGYPYDPADGREDIAASDRVLRVLRGGSFYFYQSNSRCAVRGWPDPFNSNDVRGFRVVVAPGLPLGSGSSAPWRSEPSAL